MKCFCGKEMHICTYNKIDFFECPNCGYLKKVSIPSNEKEKERYDLHICDDDYLKYMQKVYDEIKKYLNVGLSLDYGCGKVHALSNLLNNDNRLCDYYDIYYFNKLLPKKYDNIILIEVFEHINDSFEILKELKQILNKNGQILIMTKLRPSNMDNWWYIRDITHITFHTLKSLEILGETLNFSFTYDEKSSIYIFKLIE